MKRFLILLICLSLVFCLVACNNGDSNGDGGDTNTNTNTNTDTNTNTATNTNTGSNVQQTYTVNVVDQDGNTVTDVTLALVDADGEHVEYVTIGESGYATFEKGSAVRIITFELPEYHINTSGEIMLESEYSITFTIENNEPNGTATRPYVFDSEEDDFQISLEAGKTVYYVLYGGSGREFTLENASGITFTFGGTEYTADQDGVISFIVPEVETSNRAQIAVLTNTTDASVELSGSIVSLPGSLDNPYEITELDALNEAMVIKGTTVYYKWTATKTGIITITSPTEDNNIHMQNLISNKVSNYTSGASNITMHVYEGETVLIYVESNASANYNAVEFTLSCNEGTESDPIVLSGRMAIEFEGGKTLYFVTANTEECSLTITGEEFELVYDETSTDSSSGVIADIIVPADSAKVFSVTNTSGAADTITITLEALLLD